MFKYKYAVVLLYVVIKLVLPAMRFRLFVVYMCEQSQMRQQGLFCVYTNWSLRQRLFPYSSNNFSFGNLPNYLVFINVMAAIYIKTIILTIAYHRNSDEICIQNYHGLIAFVHRPVFTFRPANFVCTLATDEGLIKAKTLCVFVSMPYLSLSNTKKEMDKFKLIIK